MPETPRRGPDDDPGVADANLLFGDTQAPRKPASPSPSPGRPAVTPTDGGYGLAGDDEPESEPVAPIPVPIPIPQPAPRPKKAAAPEERAEKAPSGPEARVDQVWSRGAEWGGTLFPMGLVALVIAGLLGWWTTWDTQSFVFPALVVLIGGAILVLMSYPIVITLERPVRMTPEQAAKDFFGALSHHFPHYRRAWLLLSDQGRTSAMFDSYGAFKSYWKGRLKQIRGDRVKGMTPLAFTVANFPTEKSKGKNSLEVNYTVNVTPRDKPNDPPLESVLLKKAGFIKGPDNMWYLNQGTLPVPQAASARPGREP